MLDSTSIAATFVVSPVGVKLTFQPAGRVGREAVGLALQSVVNQRGAEAEVGSGGSFLLRIPEVKLPFPAFISLTRKEMDSVSERPLAEEAPTSTT